MSFEYRAFVSYSHQDEIVAKKLFKALEGFKVPASIVGLPGRDGPVPANLFPIFRDEDELPASADLSNQLTEALERSAVLLVLCSPAAAASRWVNEEILQFKRMGRENRILAVILSGEPNASGTPGREQLECFPPALRFRLRDGKLTEERVEPIAADLRRGPRVFQDVVLRVAAGTMGIAYDDLKQRHATAERERSFIRMAATGAIAAIVALGVGYGVFKQSRVVEKVVTGSAGPKYDGGITVTGSSQTVGYALTTDVMNEGEAFSRKGAVGLFTARDNDVELVAYQADVDPVDQIALKFGFKGAVPIAQNLPQYLLLCVWPKGEAAKTGVPIYFSRNDATQFVHGETMLIYWTKVVSMPEGSALGQPDQCAAQHRAVESISGEQASFPDKLVPGATAAAYTSSMSMTSPGVSSGTAAGGKEALQRSTSAGRGWLDCDLDRVFALPQCRVSLPSNVTSSVKRVRIGAQADHLDQLIAGDEAPVSEGLVSVYSAASSSAAAARSTLQQQLMRTYLVVGARDTVYAQVEFNDGQTSDVLTTTVQPAANGKAPFVTVVAPQGAAGPPLLVSLEDSRYWRGGDWHLAPLVGGDVTAASWSLFDGGFTPIERKGGLFAVRARGPELGLPKDALPDKPKDVYYVLRTSKGEEHLRYRVDFKAAAFKQAHAAIDLTDVFTCKTTQSQTNYGLTVKVPKFPAANCTMRSPLPAAGLFDRIYWGTSPEDLSDLDAYDEKKDADRWVDAQLAGYSGPEDERKKFETYVRRQIEYARLNDWRSDKYAGAVIFLSTPVPAMFVKVRYVDGSVSDVVRIPVT